MHIEVLHVNLDSLDVELADFDDDDDVLRSDDTDVQDSKAQLVVVATTTVVPPMDPEMEISNHQLAIVSPYAESQRLHHPPNHHDGGIVVVGGGVLVLLRLGHVLKA